MLCCVLLHSYVGIYAFVYLWQPLLSPAQPVPLRSAPHSAATQVTSLFSSIMWKNGEDVTGTQSAGARRSFDCSPSRTTEWSPRLQQTKRAREACSEWLQAPTAAADCPCAPERTPNQTRPVRRQRHGRVSARRRGRVWPAQRSARSWAAEWAA